MPTVSARAGTVDAFVLELAADGSVHWITQFGAPNASTRAGDITVLGTEVYVVGITDGELHAPALGSEDAFIRHLDANGSLASGYQFGTTEGDWASALVTNAAGHLFVGGYTSGSLEGPNAGDEDGFLIELDGNLTRVGGHQFGWSGNDSVEQLAIDSEGGIYFSGSTPGTESDSWTGGTLLGKFTPPL